MRALILVDIQNDFLPGGALAVPEGDQVVPVANRLLRRSGLFDLVVATQDWHPKGHGSFASSHWGAAPGDHAQLAGMDQVLWPDHCVQGERGAELASGLDSAAINRVFRKGTDPLIDSYSGFFDNGHVRSTGLGEYLGSQRITDLYIMGLATDYCVKFTALDALELGFHACLIVDGCRGVNLRPSDSDDSIRAMRDAGVTLIRSEELVGQGERRVS